MKKHRHLRPNKNFCNYPFARDSRVLADWRVNRKRQYQWARVPETKRVRLRFPLDANARVPDGFDAKVLWLMLHEARVTNKRRLRLGSLNEVLERLQEPVQNRERQRLRAALDLWSNLTLVYPRWKVAAIYKERRKLRSASKIKKVLPPPILKIVSEKPLVVVLSKDWYRLQRRYEARVPADLPTSAALQNLILLVLAYDVQPLTRSRRSLCRTIGLNHKGRNESLRVLLGRALMWLMDHGINYHFAPIREGSEIYRLQRIFDQGTELGLSVDGTREGWGRN